MEYLIIGGALVALFFFITGNPATTAKTHDNLTNLTDDFLHKEIIRLGRWSKHHNDGPQSFRDKAMESGVANKYYDYSKRIREEQSRRALAHSIISSIPELKIMGDAAYHNLLNDGVMKIAWEMKNTGKTGAEIISWVRSEIGSSEQHNQPEPQINLRSLVEAVVAVGKAQEVRTLLKSILKEKSDGITEEALIITAAHTFIGVSLKLIQTKYGMGVFVNALPLFEEQYLPEYSNLFAETNKNTLSVSDLIPNEIERGFIRSRFHFLKEHELPKEMLPDAFSAICSYRIHSYYASMDLSEKRSESTPFQKAAHLVMLLLYGEQKAKEFKSEEIILSNELARIDQLLNAAIKSHSHA